MTPIGHCSLPEYRMACTFLAGDEFAEGIRAAVVDKDRAPRWDPSTLAKVTSEDVDRFFHPVEDELSFEECPDGRA